MCLPVATAGSAMFETLAASAGNVATQQDVVSQHLVLICRHGAVGTMVVVMICLLRSEPCFTDR